jgi:hypothetical protein
MINNIQIPHNYTPRDYQLPFFIASEDPKIKRFVLIWHRRAGKDKTALQIMIKKMLERKGTYYYILPTYTQGKKIIWDGMDKEGFKFLDHIPKSIIKKKHEQDKKIELKNGSILQVIGSDNIDTIVGTNPVGVILSEFPLHKKEVWQLLRPILAENGGWACFTYTPRGKNHGWDIYQISKDNPKWFSQMLTVDDTNAIDSQVLEEEKKEMPLALFRQEYYCDFIDGAGQFFTNVKNCVYNVDTYELPKPKGRKFQGGIDLAKINDFTVLTPIDLATFTVYPQERFNQMDWTTQELSIENFSYRYGKPLMYVDATGVGDPIFEALDKKGLKVEPFKFTTASRAALLNNLRMLLDTGKIKIPNDPILLDELGSFKMELTDRGRLKVTVPEGLHDDAVMSLALACWKLKEYKGLNPDLLADPVGRMLANQRKGQRRQLGASGE